MLVIRLKTLDLTANTDHCLNLDDQTFSNDSGQIFPMTIITENNGSSNIMDHRSVILKPLLRIYMFT